jgi:hypothetical protein
MPTREDAWKLLCEYTASESLRKHMLAVEACVRAYARKFASDARCAGAASREGCESGKLAVVLGTARAGAAVLERWRVFRCRDWCGGYSVAQSVVNQVG